jgi:nucleoside-diphosphate-sugar epimerase
VTRVLLTGASGFLGSHIADRLAREDVTLRLMLRRTSSLRFLRDAAGKYERVEGDLRDASSMAAALADVDCVIACGGLTWARTEAEYQAVNAEGTRRLVEAALAAGVKRFVYISSLAAQGPSPDGKPLAPEQTHPVSLYGRSKRDGETPVLAAKVAMSVAILRPPIIYGPRDEAFTPLYRTIRWLRLMPLYGDGMNQLTFVHALDCADAAVRIALSETPSGAIYSVSDGAPHTWRDVALAYAKAVGRKPFMLSVPPSLYHGIGAAASTLMRLTPLQLPIDKETVLEMRQRYWVCDHEAITRDLAWTPQYDIEAGMAQTAEWYRANGWR